MDTNQKNDYFEADSLDGIDGIINIMEHNPDHDN